MSAGVRRAGFLGFLLFALLLRVSIPTGMMLVAAEGGLPRIVPCPSAMPAFAAPAAHGGHHAQPRHDHNAPEPPPCPFGVLLFPALPSAPPVLAMRAPGPEPVLVSPRVAEAPPRGPFHVRPPATGPPIPA
jgi:hypothetical protein